VREMSAVEHELSRV